MSYNIVKGDLGIPLPLTITSSGTAVDTTTADSVQLHWRQPDGTVNVDDLTAISAVAGQYKMDWEDGDTDQIGPHVGQIVVTTGAVIETYPSDGSNIIWFVNPSVADD